MRALPLSISFLVATAAIAMAQPTTSPGVVLAPLPAPSLAESSRPSEDLRAAQGALAVGHYGEAEEALEMAQTRMLDRSVALGQTDRPSDNPTVIQITQARQALAAHDRADCMQLIQSAIASATAQGL